MKNKGFAKVIELLWSESRRCQFRAEMSGTLARAHQLQVLKDENLSLDLLLADMAVNRQTLQTICLNRRNRK